MKETESNNSDAPTFVYRDSVLTESDYVKWLTDVKSRYRQSQAKAAVKVNTEMLEFYWSIGRDLVALRAESRWGAGVVKQFAIDMREAFPKATGFSYSNVKYMKRWYTFYNERVTKGQRVVGLIADEKGQQVVDLIADAEKCHQVGDQIILFKKGHQPGDLSADNEKGQQPADLISDDEKGQRLADLLEMPQQFGKVPWYHHVEIICTCQTLNEALFYLNKVADEGWSRSKLESQIAAKLYQAQGAAFSNFSRTLPTAQSQLAQEILKSPYNFEFLDIKEEHDEKQLEDALVKNVTQFLLELGKGFAYVGRQMELRIDDETTFFPDLIFYHIPQKRYVVIELKAVKFMPEFAGKLNFYVTAADKLLRGDGDNPTVGLVICKTAKQTIVEWSLQDIQKPLGVATYQLREVVERTVKELEISNSQAESVE